jgi:programmed cell death 6-interacting protein
MPNQLIIPFKQSYKAPVKQAARDYIQANTDTHPDAFKWDINRWETLREEGRGGVAHIDRINSSIRFARFRASVCMI